MSKVYFAGHTGYQVTPARGTPVDPLAPNDWPQSLRNALLDFLWPRSNSSKSFRLSSDSSTRPSLPALRPRTCDLKRGSAWSVHALSKESGREKTTCRSLQSETIEICSPELCALAAPIIANTTSGAPATPSAHLPLHDVVSFI